MIFEREEGNMNAWKTEMKIYEKSKRTKKPFGSQLPGVTHVSYKQVKAKQCLFDPVLQTFQKKEDSLRQERTDDFTRAKSLMGHLKNTAKYEKEFDIVNLHSNKPLKTQHANKKLGPIRNAYNPINNQKMPQFYFKDRDVCLPKEVEKRLIPSHQKDFNIVTNVYAQNHEQKVKSEIEQQNSMINSKYLKTHTYDPVFGQFYDSEKEEAYQQQRRHHEQAHHDDRKLPPSYVHRQPFIADFTKPLPESLQLLDQKNANAKKRFQTKYVVLDEYDKRNLEQESKFESTLKNKVHFGRILDEKAKQFNIINNNNYSPNRAEELYHKKPEIESWDTLMKEIARQPQPKSMIKSSGFS